MPSLFVAALAAVATTSSQALRVSSQSSAHAYEAFRREFGTERPDDDSMDYRARVELFEMRRREVTRHNAQPGMSWVAAVNKFADYTDSEFQAMMGHRPGRGHRAGRASHAGSLLESGPARDLAQSVDWRQKLNATMQVKDQGGCGSCWAVAAAGALETHAAMAGTDSEISYEELVDCVPNPEECGGQGGCKGATSELAFEYVQKHGLAKKSDYLGGYEHEGDGKCKPPANPVMRSQGFVRLPVNKLHPLMEAVATEGPVVVSADAGGWGSYDSGVFDSCEKNAIINHAILLVGYGNDQGLKKDYWVIRNSWGAGWGETGFIRLLRHEDENYCGTDNSPLDGVGCKGGPAALPVCGMCGILSDSAYPKGVTISKGI